ncbi:unnamed protein product [Triticum turgidum subsp. durum]|uniref:Uncharacterized protein n=1 Tax=Triticum turgidum subsp. durum TaxID=4567 RepID=A0A9R1QWV6_TRITD|nr:unnamed protein product [Triticum turgidum subsp. durum]
MGRKPSSAIYWGRLPELARRLEEILFREYPTKVLILSYFFCTFGCRAIMSSPSKKYYNMMRGAIEHHLRFAVNLLSVENQQQQQNRQSSRHGSSERQHGYLAAGCR